MNSYIISYPPKRSPQASLRESAGDDVGLGLWAREGHCPQSWSGWSTPAAPGLHTGAQEQGLEGLVKEAGGQRRMSLREPGPNDLPTSAMQRILSNLYIHSILVGHHLKSQVWWGNTLVTQRSFEEESVFIFPSWRLLHSLLTREIMVISFRFATNFSNSKKQTNWPNLEKNLFRIALFLGLTMYYLQSFFLLNCKNNVYNNLIHLNFWKWSKIF